MTWKKEQLLVLSPNFDCVQAPSRTLVFPRSQCRDGCVSQLPVFLKSGDVMEVDIEGLGVLRNPVA